MKPTGATKEAMGHSPLPWQRSSGNPRVVIDANGQIVAECRPTKLNGEQEAIDRALLIFTAVNERERLRRLLRAATSPTKCYCDVMNGNLCWQCEARAALNEVEG